MTHETPREKPLNADRRSPHTDALDTLGSVITEHEKRDAIHLAVEPAVAGRPVARSTATRRVPLAGST